MKKRVWGIVALICAMLCFALLFAACDKPDDMQTPNETPSEEVHVHAFGEWSVTKQPSCVEGGAKERVCACGEKETASMDKVAHTEVIDEAVEPTVTATGLTEGKHCSVCNTVLVAQNTIPMLPSETTLSAKTLTVDGRSISGKLRHESAVFSFAEDITVTNNAPWVVSTDVFGMHTVATKTVPLAEGNNTFYIHVTHPDQTVATYTVNLYRNHLYTVRFNANGGTSVDSQRVEEGYLATAPTTTRAGYTFAAWDYDFETPITANMTINANWNANGDTPYKVEYYLENVDKNGYDLVETVNLTGATDTTAYAEQKTFAHFALNAYASTLNGNIDGDGGRVLKVYYTRNTYRVSVNDTSFGSITNAGNYVYEDGFELTLTASEPNLGYAFAGWYAGEELLSTSLEYTTLIDKNIVAKFDVVSEMQNFIFTSSATTCTISGVKDKTITEIVVPNYVTNISEGAFSGCSSLESITMPFVKMTSIGSCTFFGFVFGSSNYDGGVETLQELYSINFYQYISYIPASLKTITITAGHIPDGAFSGCDFNNITLCDGVIDIGYEAFHACSLTSITIPDSVTSIGNRAFSGCTSLASVTIGDSVTSIGDSAFSDCTSLTSVTIGEKVTSIGLGAFVGCYKLIEVYNRSGLSITKGSSAYGYVGFNVKNVYTKNVGASKLSITADGWIFYIDGNTRYLMGKTDANTATTLTLPADCNGSSYEIYKFAFYYCRSLTSVTIGDSVTSIGDLAFSDCTSLTSVTISDSVTYIGYGAFSYCASLTSVTIGEKVTIGSSAFMYCTSLTSVTIPDSVTSIGNEAFKYCTSLTSVTFENPDGWWVSTSSSATSGESVDVSNASTAATLLTDTYYNYYWKRS